MNIYAGTYNGQIFMLSGHPTNMAVKRRNQISQTSIRSLYLPSNSSELLTGGFDGQLVAVNKFNLQSTKQTKQPHGTINCIQKINENVVAVGHENGLVRFWDWKSWNLKRQIREHKKALRGFCIDKNDVLFFSVANNGLILWNTQKYEKVFHYKFDYEIQHVLIDESLEYILLINQKQIHQIKTQNNEQVAKFKIQTAQMIQTAVIFLNYVIIGGDKGNIFIYALGQYEHKISFQAHKLRVKSMKIIKFDEIDYLVSASSSGQISVWDVLQFLKEVQKIGQDYQLDGLEPLCSINLDTRVICIEVGLIEAGAGHQVQAQKKKIQKLEEKKPINNKSQKSGKKLPPQEQKKEQAINSKKVILSQNKKKKINKKNKKHLLIEKLKQKQQNAGSNVSKN